jgi:glutamate mutase epsilon subunit
MAMPCFQTSVASMSNANRLLTIEVSHGIGAAIAKANIKKAGIRLF